MTADLLPARLLLVTLAGWVNRHQQHVIEYFVEENRGLREQLSGRGVRLTDDQRRLSFAKTLFARLINLRSVWGLETLETGTRPEVRAARRRPYPAGTRFFGAPRTIRKDDGSRRREPGREDWGLILLTLPAGCSGDAGRQFRGSG